jgi:hypothetical protein
LAGSRCFGASILAAAAAVVIADRPAAPRLDAEQPVVTTSRREFGIVT